MKKLLYSLILGLALLPNIAFGALTDNQVMYWNLDGNSNDAVSNKNGSETNVSFSAGKIGSGAVFAGNSKITATFAPGTSFSYSYWIKYTGSNRQGILGWGALGSGSGVNKFLQINSTVSAGDIYLNPNDIYTSGGSTLYNGSWHHIVVTWTDPVAKIYVDGVEKSFTGSADTNWNVTDTNFIMGLESLNNQNWFTGSIDEFGVWSRSLSSTEVSQLYNSGAGFAYPFTVETSISTVSSATLGYDVSARLYAILFGIVPLSLGFMIIRPLFTSKDI